MNSTNRLIKISGIMYLIVSLITIGYFNLYGGISLILGITLLSYSFLSIEELKSKKIILTIIAIVSIFSNMISSILLFIANSEISSTQTENKQIKEDDEISSESKRIDILLKIGLGMILISGILFATTSWETIPNIVKCISLLLAGFLFIGLSRFTEIKLKIEKTTKSYFIIGLLFILLSFIGIAVLETISPWFTYIGEGKNLVYFLTFIIIASILFIIDYKFKQKECNYMGYMCSFISMYHILLFIGLNLELTVLVLTTVIFILNILLKEKNNYIKELSKEISFIFWPAIIVQGISDFEIITIISSVIAIINIIYLTLNEEEKVYNILATIINYILIINIALRLQLDYTNIILFALSTVFYMFANNNKLNDSMYIKNTNQVIYNILATTIIISSYNQPLQVFIISIIYGVVNFINCYLTNYKDSKFDLYYQPIIIVTIISSSFGMLDEIISVNGIYIELTYILMFAIINLLVKNSKIKNIYFVALIIISILTALSNIIESNIIVGIVIILISIYVYKQKTHAITYISILLSILLLKNNIVDNVIDNVYTIQMILEIILIAIYGGLTYLYKNNITLKKINLFAIIVPLYSLTLVVDLQENIKVIIMNILALYILFLIVTLFIKQQSKDIIATIGTAFIILSIVGYGDLLIGLYIGIIGIITIFITHNKKSFKALFYCGVAITIINILFQLGDFWTQIPLWLYLLLVGGAIITFVTVKELKRQKQPKEQIETKKEELKEKVIVENIMPIQTNRFCPNCGTPNNGSKFCRNCGTPLTKKTM